MVDFRFNVPVEFFEKASAPEGQRRRIGGVISTENRDQEGEVVLQRGLDLEHFLKKGWLNDNHSKATADGVLGYPTEAKQFRKGERLPNGKIADANSTWFEGYLLKGWPPADKIWKLGKALQGSGRSLGYSVEGKIVKRSGAKTVFKKSADGRGEWVGDTITRALVRNVAITNCPVNAETSLEVLSKAFAAAEADTQDTKLVLTIEKTMTMGTATPGVAVSTQGPFTGAGAGKVLAVQDLEREGDGRDRFRKKKKKKLGSLTEKSLSQAEAEAWVQSRIPGLPDEQAAKFVQTVRRWKAAGTL